MVDHCPAICDTCCVVGYPRDELTRRIYSNLQWISEVGDLDWGMGHFVSGGYFGICSDQIVRFKIGFYQKERGILMPVSAWIMFGFGCLVLYGGLLVCLVIAFQKRDDIGKKSQSKNRKKS